MKYFEYEGEGLPWQNIARQDLGDKSFKRAGRCLVALLEGARQVQCGPDILSATIESLTKHGAMVTFTDYGNKEELASLPAPTPTSSPRRPPP